MDEREKTAPEFEAPVPETGARRLLLGRAGLVVLWAFGLSLILGALLVVGLAALVAHGPVEIASAARTAETLLGEIAGPGGRARVGGARLDWSWQEGISVDLETIEVERDGALAMRVPRAEIHLRFAPLLLGDVRPRSLVLIEPHLAIDAAGFAAPPAADPATAPAKPQRMLAVASEAGRFVDRVLERARGEGIARFALRNGTIEFRRADPSRRVVVLPEIEAEAAVDGPGGELDLGWSARGEVGRWSMRFTATRDGDGRRRLAFVADDVTHRDLFGAPGPAFELGMPIYPRATLFFRPDGVYDGAEFDLRLGAGVFRFGPMPEDAMIVDEAQAQLEWKAGSKTIDIRNLVGAVGETGMTLHGRIVAPDVADGPWDLQLEADGGSFRPRDVPGKPMTVDGGRLSARIDPKVRAIDIAEASAAFGTGWVKTAGRIDYSGEEPSLKLDLGFSALDIEQVKRAWPHWVAAETRAWVIGNVSAGRIQDLVIRLDMPRFDKQETWPGNAFRLSGRFDGAKFRTLGNLPPVVGGEGRITIGDRRMDLSVDRAQVGTKAAKRPTLEGFRFTVADIFVKPPKGQMRFQVSGDVAALAEVVNCEPLAVLDEAGVKLDGLSGTGVVTSQIDILFEHTIKPSSVDYRIEANLDHFSSPHPIQGRKFQDGKFRIVADTKGVKVTGRAQIDGVVTDVDMYDARDGSKGVDKRGFKMVLDDAARQRIGLDLGDLVQGAISLSVAQPSQTDTRRRVEVDLTPARLNLGPVGWSKGSGVPAKAALDLVDDDKGVRLENLTLESEGLAIAGTVQLDKERRLVSADFGRFALRKGDSAKLKISRGTDQAFVVGFEAQNFDLRGLMQSHRKASGDEAARAGGKAPVDYLLKLRAARLVGFNDVSLADVSFDGRYKGEAFQTLQISARSGGGRSLSVSIKPDGGARRLAVSAEDGGATLSFLDIFDRVVGGRLVINARLDGSGVAQGGARLDDFRLLEEPKTGRLAPVQTAEGVQQIKVRRAGINPQTDFSRSSVRFAMRDGVVTVTEAVAKGNSVGATASGQIDLNNQRLALAGTYIPAFGLNNLAGRIPVFGAITGAGSNEGLVGVTFRIFGAVEDPILEINPLSAIAPGIFRRIFEFQNDRQVEPAPAGNAPTRITP